MAKKTWKIGEYAKGGIIQSIVIGDTITILGKEWVSKEVFTKLTVRNSGDAYRELSNFLNDLTTNYYSDKIMDWVGTKIEIRSQSLW